MSSNFEDLIGGAKPWYASVGVWGGIIAAASPLIAVAGYEIDASQAADTLAALGSIVGGALAIYGRIWASSPILRKR